MHFSAYNEYLFGDGCVTVQEVGSRHIYPIFKNGSTTISSLNGRNLSLNEIEKLEVIDVYVRNPKQRLRSGIHTFLTLYCSHLDRATSLYFIKKFFYLDRHFSPQIFWLINLNRFYRGEVMIRSVDKLSELTNKKFNVNVEDTSYLDEVFEDPEFKDKIELICQLDHAILALQGKRLPIDEVFRSIREHCPRAYDIVIYSPYTMLSSVQDHMETET